MLNWPYVQCLIALSTKSDLSIQRTNFDYIQDSDNLKKKIRAYQIQMYLHMKGMSTKGIHDGIFKILVEGSCSYSTVNKLVADFKRGKVSLTEIHDQVSKNLRLQTIRPQGYIFFHAELNWAGNFNC